WSRSASSTRSPRCIPAPGTAAGDGLRAATGEGGGLTGAGPSRMRIPGRPRPAAPARAARTASASTATVATTSTRRTGRHDPHADRHRAPRSDGTAPTSIRTRTAVAMSAPPGEAGPALGQSIASVRSPSAAASPASSSSWSERSGRSAIEPSSSPDTGAGARLVVRALEPPAEVRERARRPRLDGARRDPERLGRLGLGQAEQVSRANHLTLLVAQGIECGHERPPRLVREDHGLRRRLAVVARGDRRRAERKPGAAIRRSAPVPRLIGDDPQEPRPERRVATEPRQRGVGLEERVLDCIGGVGLRGDEMGGAQRDVLVAPHEQLVRGDITSTCAVDQLGVVQVLLRVQPYQLHRPGPPGSGYDAARDPPRRRVTGGRVFRRATAADPPVAVEGRGSTIRDATGREYLDAAGGAIVVNVGHGRRSIADAMADQAARLAYAHGSAFTTDPLEAYAREVGPHLPVDDPAIYPVSGGSEAIETALKMARAYHLARGDADRWIVFARWGSYHGNTLGALDLSGRRRLRRPYEGWLGRFRHVSAAYPYRAGLPGSNALGNAEELAAELDRLINAAGPDTVAAFVAEPIVGATLAAVEPPEGYW